MLGDSIGLVVANDPNVMGEVDTRVTMLGQGGFVREASGSKEAVAAQILDCAMEIFRFPKKGR